MYFTQLGAQQRRLYTYILSNQRKRVGTVRKIGSFVQVKPQNRKQELQTACCAANDVQPVIASKTWLSLSDVQELVEVSMLAAVSGLIVLLETLLKISLYSSYLLPLIIVVAGARRGPAASFKTMINTFCLLFVLLGPVRGIIYCLRHGIAGACLGMLWSRNVPWWISVPMVACVRSITWVLYVLIVSWLLNEDLFAVLLDNIFHVLDRVSSSFSISVNPTPIVVISTIFAMVVVQEMSITSVSHIVFFIFFKKMGLPASTPPKFVQKFVGL